MSRRDALDMDVTVVTSEEQVSCELDDDAVVLSLRDGVYYGLNPVAARIWAMLGSPMRLGEIRDRLLDEYDVDAERCTRDLLEVVQQLLDWKLVDLVEDTARVPR